MKNTFPEYNPLSKEKLQQLWDNAIFIFDTNVILNLYRYSDETSNEFLETIIKLKDRVWLPYQVGFEFNKNRLSVISDQKKQYEEFEKKINDIISEIENKNKNPFLSKPLFEKLISVKSDIKNEVDAKIKLYDSSLVSDKLLDSIHLAFDGKIGPIFKPEELKQIFSEGEKRYKEEIPPGYCDIKKPENKKYGDLIIWKQIMTKSKIDNIDIIFVLDDRKEDWWLEHQGKTISPRPELLKEFNIETKKSCHFYKPFQFLEYSNEYLGNAITVEVIEEVKNYAPEILQHQKFIQIKISLEGALADLNILANDMKTTGYDLFIETNTSSNNNHNIYIILPNIPDLERRLNTKYISNLVHYNLNLLSVVKT